MKIEEVITEFNDWTESGCHPEMRPHINAIYLAIEALKAVQKARRGVLIDNVGRLPGETNE